MNWSTLLHHVVNEHKWITGAYSHDPLTGLPTDPDEKELEYLTIKNQHSKPSGN